MERYNTQEHTLVSHNLEFDTLMLQKEGFVWQGEMIDTLKCARRLIKETEHYSLQFLRYELKLYKKERALADSYAIAIMPHNALSDALHVKLLYEELLSLASYEELIELTRSRALIEKFSFGKYRGRYIEEIARSDRGYLAWMLGAAVDLDEDLRYSIEYYLEQTT